MTEASARIVAEAADWAALLDSQSASAAQHTAFRRWRDADPAHRETIERMLACAPAAGVSRLERRALDRLLGAEPEAGRRRLMGGAALALLLAGLGGVAGWRSDGVQDRFPDYQVAVGGLRSADLADGSTLTVDSGSAVRTDVAGRSRNIRLLRGRVLAHVAHDPARPFVVETPDGTATALGTAFTVSREQEGTLVEVAASRVRACAAGGAPCRDLGPGGRALIAGGRVSALRSAPAAGIGQWASGWLEVDDQEVSSVVDALNRYRTVPIRHDAAALAGIRVTGSYPLADQDRTLKAIGRTPGAAIVQDGDGAWRLIRRRGPQRP
ncbi:MULTISPECIES: FecR domain-containing protein [unclassified Novosphingobium]|uniref:FecR family protein n=1 Tax=unclassified Novosphingobium TaxID=2644732 RepID=UPI00135C9A83|nr:MULTISPECIES: FecR domain-containing protein [unclassified Novosphingobium]